MGDELGDCLQLPFEVAARRRARRVLAWVRVYGYACESAVLGGLLIRCHGYLLKMVALLKGEELFPMLCPSFKQS